MFENQLFDHWLQQKSEEILSKIDKEKISTEDKLILTLKAQTNHFHHMDIDVNKRFESIEKRFEEVDRKFEEVDRRFDRLDQKIDNRFMWMIGITIAMSGGIYLKLFLG